MCLHTCGYLSCGLLGVISPCLNTRALGRVLLYRVLGASVNRVAGGGLVRTGAS